MLRILSGIQPSGDLHIGNYFGMMKPMIEYQEVSELYCFIVNFHAMTSVSDRERLAWGTMQVALDFLALGLDPEKAIFWVQSDVPRSDGANLDPEQCHPGGAPSQEPFLQGQNRSRPCPEPWAAVLSGSHGGRHSPLSGSPGSGGQGPAAALGDHPGLSHEVQQHLRGHFCGSGSGDQSQYSDGGGSGWSQNE